MKTVFGEDWAEKIKIIFAGDDVTDEDAMSALKGVAHSFRYVQPYSKLYIWLLHNPYVNEVALTGQKPPSKCN